MASYAALGVVAVTAAALGGVIYFAHKAGKDAQKADDAAQEEETAASVTSATKAMSDAAANSPATDAAVIAAFQKGQP